MLGFLKRIKIDTSWKLLCYLLYYGKLEVTVTFKEVAEETGIKSHKSYIAAREELVKHGIITVEKQGHNYVIRLTGQQKPTEPIFVEPVLPEEDPIEPVDPWLERAEAIECLPEKDKKRAQLVFLAEAFKEFYPAYSSKHPLSPSSVTNWLRFEQSTVSILDMLRQVAEKPNIAAPPSYITAALRGRKAEPTRQEEEPEWPEDPKVAKGRDLLKRFKVTVPSLLDRGFGDD
jgi:hypothetical protein